MRRIRTPEAPAIGAYSQAIAAKGELLFTGPQIGLTSEGELVSGGIEAQTYQAMANLQKILGAAGCRLVDLVSTSISLTDKDHFPIVSEIYESHFDVGLTPSPEYLVVAGIPYGTETDPALIQMSMIAEVPPASHSASTLVGRKQLRI